MAEKIFLIDIGNTNTSYGLYENGRFLHSGNIKTREVETLQFPAGVPIAGASVVPGASEKLKKHDIFWVGHTKKLEIDLSLVEKEQVGADRIANLEALAHLAKLPAMVIDCGTALTVEALSEKKVFIGGVIAPGRQLLRNALSTYTAQLPFVPVNSYKNEKATFGWNTVDSIIWGTNAGIIGAVKEFISAAKKILEVENITSYAAGGDAEILIDHIPELIPLPDNFTLLGVYFIWKNNRQ